MIVAASLAGIAVLAILIGTLSVLSLQRKRRSMAELTEAVDTMRRVLVRPVPRTVGTTAAQVCSVAAAWRAGVGGDLYDVVSTPFGTRLIIGDVKGKGLGAVETAADVLGAFRELAQHEPNLPAIAKRLDYMLARRGHEEEFVTALLATIPDGAAVAELACCGHPPPLLIRDGQATFIDVLTPAPPLAILRLSDASCVTTVIPFAATARLLFYTDGVTEARDTAGNFYPLRERAAALRDRPDFLQALQSDLLLHVGGRLRDDAVLLLIESTGQVVPAPDRT